MAGLPCSSESLGRLDELEIRVRVMNGQKIAEKLTILWLHSYGKSSRSRLTAR